MTSSTLTRTAGGHACVGPCPGCPCSLNTCVAGGCAHVCCCPHRAIAATHTLLAGLPSMGKSAAGLLFGHASASPLWPADANRNGGA